jgi:site-specific DNA-methyltransferase (adenine-specific)
LDKFLNQIICGDCLEVMPQIPDKSVDMILCDIPYDEVNMDSNGLRLLDKGLADTLDFDLNSFLVEILRICQGSFYVFCGIEQVSIIRKTFKENGLSTRHCVWEKTNPSPMNGQHLWLSSIENCIYAKKPGAYFNEMCKSSVWRYPCGSSKQHPTEKPLSMFEYLAYTSCPKDGIIFDPCIGSGTTAIAAHNTGRFFIGIEKEPKYCEIARKRLEQAQLQQTLFGGDDLCNN